MQIIIAPRAPYNFAHTAAATRFLYTAVHLMSRGVLRRVIRIGEGLALVELSGGANDEDAPQIAIRVLATDGAVDAAVFEAKAALLVNARPDLDRFYSTNDDPLLEQIVRHLRGLHALGADTLFEAVGLTMIEQQITLKMAQTAERWLMAWGGGCLKYEGVVYYTFPTPERLANATEEEIAPMKITRIRLRRLIALAKGIVNGGSSFESLRDATPDEVYARLRQIDGVGHWTAAWAMIRGMGHYAYLGNADVALRAAVNHYFFGQAGRADRAEMDVLFARYGDYSGLAAFYTLMRWAFERY